MEKLQENQFTNLLQIVPKRSKRDGRQKTYRWLITLFTLYQFNQEQKEKLRSLI